MSEEEANDLIAQVGADVDEAIEQWRLQGADNRGAGIHQIFTREFTSGKEGVIPNEANWTGIVGLSGTQTYTLKFRYPGGQEYAEPTPWRPRRYDGSFLRKLIGAGELDFVQHVSPSGAISMRVFIADPWGRIDGQNCAKVTDLTAPYGGRPYLSIPNDGGQYAIFKSANCGRVRYIVGEGMPIPDTLTGGDFTYNLYKRSFSGDWMPAAPTYEIVNVTETSVTYSGIVTSLWSSCMGFRTVNIAPEGEPPSTALVFIADEFPSADGQSVFGFSEDDDIEYISKGFDGPGTLVFERVGVFGGNIPITGGAVVNQTSLNFNCP